jgi:hypothetical protein
VGIDKDYTIEDMRVQSVEKLYDIMASCGTPGYYQMAVEELQRRFLREMASQTQSLAESSQRVEAIASGLNGSVTAMDASVQRLADSSDKMERLTKGIIWLTVTLLLFTAVQVVMLFRDQGQRPAASAPTAATPAASATPASPPE